jgi:hypothetical protein
MGEPARGGTVVNKIIVGFTVVIVFALLARTGAVHAVDEPIVGFDDSAAVAANGPIPGTDGIPETTPEAVCGSNVETYLSELLDTPPSQVKVIDHWADVIRGKEMMVSGIVHDVSLGGTDLPFDHPFSSDLNFDVEPDPPYAALAKRLGTGAGDPDAGGADWLHVELELGQLLHDPALVVHGPAAGEPWDVLPTAPPQNTLNGDTYTGLQLDYVPQNGDRIVVMGRWIIDCGHDDFHAELHPLTFMAFGHAVGAKTIVHVVANPYRVTQRYSSTVGGAGANQVNDRSRFGVPFAPFLEGEVLRLVLGQRDHLQAPVLLEAVPLTPLEWHVCTPPGTSGRFVQVVSNFVRQRHVRVRVNRLRDPGGGFHCVRVRTRALRGYSAQDPPLRQCDMPWDWLNAQAADQGGFPADFDLRPYIKAEIQQAAGGVLPQEQIDAAIANVDNTPTSVCYDSLAGPLPDDPPSPIPRKFWRRVRRRPDQPFPFYGTIELSWQN